MQVATQESVLMKQPNGSAIRLVSVLNLFIFNDDGQVSAFPCAF